MEISLTDSEDVLGGGEQQRRSIAPRSLIDRCLPFDVADFQFLTDQEVGERSDGKLTGIGRGSRTMLCRIDFIVIDVYTTSGVVLCWMKMEDAIGIDSRKDSGQEELLI